MGSLFQQTAEQQKWLDRAKIDQTIMQVYIELGHNDEKLTSTLQQLTTDSEARKQKIRSLSWASGVTSTQDEYKDLLQKAEEYCLALQKETESSSPEKIKFYQTVKQGLQALRDLESVFLEEIQTFTKTTNETKGITTQYVGHAIQKAQRFSQELTQTQNEAIAKNEQWKTSQQIEWSERHHRFLTTLDNWIQSFLTYQNATIALISVHKTLRSQTSIFRGLAKDFLAVLPNHHPAQQKYTNQSIHSTMMHETSNRDGETPMTKKICRVMSQWIMLLTPIAEEIRAFRRKMKAKIGALESKVMDMKAKEELSNQMIREAHDEQAKYYNSITHAKKIEPTVIENHQKIKKGLLELEARQRRSIAERKKLEQELESLIRLHKNTAVSPPDNILEQLSEEENQLMLQRAIIGEVLERNHGEMMDHSKHQVDQFLRETTEKIATDLGTVMRERDQLFSESLARVNPDNMGGKQIASFFSNLEYVGKVLKEDAGKLQLFRSAFQALQNHYFVSIQKAIVEMNL